MTTILGILILSIPYFIPTIVAWIRKNHVGAIFALNLFLGWTLVGWVAALVMALWSNNREPAWLEVDDTPIGPVSRRALKRQRETHQPIS